MAIAIKINTPEMTAERAQAMLDDVLSKTTPAERSYIEAWVENIVFPPVAKMKKLAGAYVPKFKAVFMSADPKPEIPSQGLDEVKFTLIHELLHPVYALAAQDGRARLLIIPPSERQEAQQRAKELYPGAIQKMDEALGLNGDLQHCADHCTPQERIAMLAYMYLDERYYDGFGSTIMASEFGIGYTTPDRNHEVACNLRALAACEADILGAGQPGVVEQVAGNVLSLLEQKVSRSLQNPNRPPKADIYSGGPNPTGGG